MIKIFLFFNSIRQKKIYWFLIANSLIVFLMYYFLLSPVWEKHKQSHTNIYYQTKQRVILVQLKKHIEILQLQISDLQNYNRKRLWQGNQMQTLQALYAITKQVGFHHFQIKPQKKHYILSATVTLPALTLFLNHLLTMINIASWQSLQLKQEKVNNNNYQLYLDIVMAPMLTNRDS